MDPFKGEFIEQKRITLFAGDVYQISVDLIDYWESAVKLIILRIPTGSTNQLKSVISFVFLDEHHV
jgi:hypothetical protein